MNVQDCILQSFIFSILISFLLSWQVVCEEGDSYAYSKYGRFCHEIKMNYSPYVNYFTRVYWNRSYFVYRINTVISFQSWKSMQASFWGLTVVEFSWKNSFWLRKLFLQIHVGAVYWPDFWVLFFSTKLELFELYRPTVTDTFFEGTRKLWQFYCLYKKAWQSSMFLHLSSHCKAS